MTREELSKNYYKLIDVALIIFAIIIPFSRMYVGVHYPGDVLAGAVIGIVGALVINRYENSIIKVQLQAVFLRENGLIIG